MRTRSLKLALGLLFALVIAYGATSWYAGRLAQKHIQAWVEQANQAMQSQWPQAAAQPQLLIQEYQRGLFTSHIRYDLDIPDTQGHLQKLAFQDDLQHGPWPWAALRDGIWQPLAAYSQLMPLPASPVQGWFDAVGPGTLPWVLRARIGFDGQSAAELDLAAARTAEGTLNFSGARIKAEYDPQACRLVFSGLADALDLTDPNDGMQTRLKGLEFNGQNTCDGGTNQQFMQQIRFQQIELLMPDFPALTLRKPVFSLNTARTGSLMDSRVDYDLGHVLMNQQDLGQIQAVFQVEHLNFPAAQALAAWFSTQPPVDTDDEELSLEDQQALRTLLLPFLATSPQLSLNAFRWATPQGTTELKTQVAFRPAGDKPSQDPGILIENSIQHVTMNLQLSKPMLLQVVRQTQTSGDPEFTANLVSMMFDQYAARLQRQGLVRIEQGNLLSDLHYADGMLTVNEITAPLVDFAKLLEEFPVLP